MKQVVKMKAKIEDFGTLGKDGFIELKDKKGKTDKGQEFEQVKVVKFYKDEMIRVIKDKADGTSMIRYARDNVLTIVATSSIETRETPILEWD